MKSDFAKGRIISIGDLHGELFQLQEVINKVGLRKSDRIIFLGDYIDRGRHSKQVIDYIIDLKTRYDVICLEGNHEMMAQDVIKGRGGLQSFSSWTLNGGRECLDSYGEHFNQLGVMEDQHGEFLGSLKLVHEEDDYIFCHGYLDCDKDVDEQNGFSVLWNRFENIQPHKSGKTVVCGHTIQRGGITNMGYKVCIDTGSFLKDGYLTAMIIDGDGVDYVDSR